MLVKGWIRELDRKLRRIPDLQKRAVVKELREQGMLRWRLPDLITILPSLILLSLLLFFAGLTIYLFYVHKLPAFLSVSIFGTGLLLYILSIFVSAIDEFSPFRSSYSRALGGLYRRLYSHLTDSLGSHSTMALPQTINEKIHERVITFIQEHIPLSEQAILEPSSSSSDEIISRTSVPILNKLFSSIAEWDASIYSKNVSMCILRQIDDLNIRSPGIWPFLRHYDMRGLSIKEAQCLAYSICMQDHNIKNFSWKAVVEVLDQSSDPWFHLVASFLWARCNSRVGVSGIPEREADILHAISNTEHLTTDEWGFALSSISALFPRGMANSQHIRSFARILARLLQKRVYYVDRSLVEGNGGIDLWLYTMTCILDKRLPATQIRVTSSLEKFLHARDIEVYGNGMSRDPNCIRRLLQLSRDQKLDPSLMGGCLVSILFILLRLSPGNEQEIRLVNQYIGIIEEEMDVTAWSFSLSEFFTNQHDWPDRTSNTVLCLVNGRYIKLADNYFGNNNIMHQYDIKLNTANVQPTTSILGVMDYVVSLTSIIGLEMQNAWLSLYANNRTRSPHNSAIPDVWSSGGISIASRRLDLYDRGRVTPEINLVLFFLSCPSASIACRALRWYLDLKNSATTSSDANDFVPFPTIFRKGLSADEKCQGWSLLVDVLIPSLKSTPLEWRARFVETFFGYGSSRGEGQGVTDLGSTHPRSGDEEKDLDGLSTGIPASATHADGLGWMEDVWREVLRPLVREVHIDHVGGYWSELSRVMPEAYPGSAAPNEPNSSHGPSTSVGWDVADEKDPYADEPPTTYQRNEEYLEASGRGLLGVLALLLPTGDHLMPAALLERLRNSPLLSDERLRHDTESLSRINAVLTHNQDD